MAGITFPLWLQNSKSEITESREWKAVVDELFAAIQQQLTESHVTYFTDLTEAEKSLFMDKATRAIQPGEVYKSMLHKVSYTLDRHLSNQVAQELLEEDPVETKPELVIEHAREGAVSLLRRWPDLKSKLHHCLNQRLPANIRFVAWRLYLQNTLARKVYCDQLSANPQSLHSSSERDIHQKCDALLTAVPVFARAFPEARTNGGIVNAMTRVLSYYHSKLRTSNRLIDVQYLILIPLLLASLDAVKVDGIYSAGSQATLIEEYISLTESRPAFVKDSWGEGKGDQLRDFSEDVSEELSKLDKSLADHIVSVYSDSKVSDGSPAKSIGFLGSCVKSMVLPLIRSMFVGFLEMPVTMYIWDQFIIGLDVPDFNVFIGMSAILIKLLKDQLLKASTPKELEDTVQRQAIFLTVESFQYEYQRNYYGKHKELLINKNLTDMPIVDPVQTFGVPAPWTHWSKEVIPERKNPKDRKYAREQRAAIRLQEQKTEKELDREKFLDSERRRLAEDEDFVKQLNTDRQRNENERLTLEEELEKERIAREETQKLANAEIYKLQEEVQKLRRQIGQGTPPPPANLPQPPSAQAPSRISFGFPPPTPAATDLQSTKPAAGHRSGTL